MVGGPPAILEGWFERVLAYGFAYVDGHRFESGLFRGRRALLSVTTGGTTARFGPDGSMTARKLFSMQSRLENVSLVPMEPVVVRSRDARDLLCYLSRPAGDSLGPVPMVLVVHGGPWSRDKWALNSMHQWLANRGYAVLSVNFRGSTGFGKAFINAANMEWGGKMHDDLIDAVDWAISKALLIQIA